MNKRKEILKELIEFRGEPSELIKQLSQFEWDSGAPLVKLELSHVIKVLQSYIDGGISKSQVENWANAIEVRDDIEFNKTVKDLIYTLANSEISDQEINQTWAKETVKKFT